MPQEEQPVLLTVAEAAKLLRLSRSQVYNLVSAGQLPTVRLGPRGIRIPRQALLDWIAAHTEPGHGPDD